MEVKGFLIKFHIDFISTAVIGLLWRHLIIRGAKLMGMLEVLLLAVWNKLNVLNDCYKFLSIAYN